VDATSRIAALAGPAAASAGLVVDGVEVTHASGRTRVLVTLDLPEDEVGSASLDAIAHASRAIGAALDDANVPDGAYTLEVGTPGVDRALTQRRHFMRARTRLVTLQLSDGGTATGRLIEVEGEDLVLESTKGVERVPLARVRSGRVEIEFRRLEDANFDGDSVAGDEGEEG
jgi:ribosome maturation factor RimP